MKKSIIYLITLVLLIVIIFSSILIITGDNTHKVNCYLLSDRLSLLKEAGVIRLNFVNGEDSKANLDVYLILPEQNDLVLSSYEDLSPRAALIEMAAPPVDILDKILPQLNTVRIDAYISGTDQLCFSETAELEVLE